MAVRRCFSFSDLNTTVELVDGRGCPDPAIMSQFSYDSLTGTAQARLFSMFKFPESNRVHFQCDIVICKGMILVLCRHHPDISLGECSPAHCAPAPEALPAPQARSLAPAPVSDPLALVQDPDSSSSALMASYSVFVLEPGSGPVERALDCEADCTWGPVWLLYLCIAFGILFVVMLMINLFLCSTMSCACSRRRRPPPT